MATIDGIGCIEDMCNMYNCLKIEYGNQDRQLRRRDVGIIRGKEVLLLSLFPASFERVTLNEEMVITFSLFATC